MEDDNIEILEKVAKIGNDYHDLKKQELASDRVVGTIVASYENYQDKDEILINQVNIVGMKVILGIVIVIKHHN